MDPYGLNKLLFNVDFDQIDLLAKLRTDAITPRELGDRMAPFFFAVLNWVQHLKNYRKKAKDDHLWIEWYERCNEPEVKIIKENIDDELGFVDGIQLLEKAHTVTFINFLHALGYNGELKISDAVNKFNKKLEKILENYNTAYNACILGGIEFFYMHISKIISDYCIRAHIKQDHYANHEVMDQKHYQDFFKIADIYGKYNFIGVEIGRDLILDVFRGL